MSESKQVWKKKGDMPSQKVLVRKGGKKKTPSKSLVDVARSKKIGKTIKVGNTPANRAALPAERTTMLSPCAIAYAIARTDPHALLGAVSLPCIPDGLAPGSFKFASRTRFEFTIGVNGCGGAAFWPGRHAANNALTVPPAAGPAGTVAQCAACTDANYALTTANFGAFPWLNPAALPTGVVPIASSNSLFRADDFGNAAVDPNDAPRGLRLVGSAVRIGYTGSVVDQRGTLTLYRNPEATANVVPSNDQLAEMLDNNMAVRLNVKDMSSDNANSVSFAPVILTDTSFVGAPYAHSQLVRADGTLTVSAMSNRLAYWAFITGATPGTTYTADYVSFFEATGSKLPLTRGDSDPYGFAAVAAAHGATRPDHDPRRSLREVIAAAGRSLARGSGHVLRSVASDFVFGALDYDRGYGRRL